MERKNMNPQQVDQLLQAASKKLGVPPEQLRSELESGKYDKVLKNMSQKIRRIHILQKRQPQFPAART